MLDRRATLCRDAGKYWQTNGNGGEMRRRFQVGHVFKRGKRVKVWVGCYREWTMEGGKLKRTQRRQVIGLCAEMTKSQAGKHLQEILRPINDGKRAPEQFMTFGQFAVKWKESVLPTYRESTREFYRYTLEHSVLPFFAEWKLGGIKTPDVQEFMNRFSQGYSASVMRHVRATLGRVMATAVDWQYIEHNPVSGIRLARGKATKQARTLTPEEVRKIIASLEQPYQAMVLVAVTTGMRESELFGLRWDDLDALRGVIRVRSSLYRGKVDITKTEKSTREIPCLEIVQRCLLELQHSEHNRGEFIFTAPMGGLFHSHRILRVVLRPLAVSLGMEPFSWRSFRRSTATFLHHLGVPLKVQQQILGHARPDMSLLYTDSGLAEARQALEKVGGLLLPSVANLQHDEQLERVN